MEKFDLKDVVFGTKWKKLAGYPSEKILIIQATLHNKLIGNAEFLLNEKLKTLKALDVGVDQNYRRKGVATAMYNKAEALTGLTVMPGDDQTEEAENFWANRNRTQSKLLS